MHLTTPKASAGKDNDNVPVSVMDRRSNIGLGTKFFKLPLYLYFIAIFAVIGVLYIVISHASPVYSTISANSSGQCLNVNGSSSKKGTNIIQWPCSTSAKNNLWQLVPGSTHGYYEIVADSSGQCLNVSGNSTKEGANIIQWPCSTSARNNLFKLVPSSTSGYYEIVADSSGQCLNVNGNSTKEGANIIQWPCSTSARNNLWSGIVLSSTLPTLAPSVSLSANPTSITSGQASTLTWTTNNATSCTASGGWSGTKAASGSVATAALSATTTYDISCTAVNQTPATAAVTITVTAPPTSTTPPPTSTSGCTYNSTVAPCIGSTTTGASGWGTATFDDEFNGSSVNTTSWNTENGWEKNDITVSTSNETESGGNLILTLSSSSSGAEISTNSYTLPVGGFAEARIDFPGSGTTVYNWPAWWTAGSSWPASGENDIFEGLGNSATLNYHYGQSGTNGSQLGPFNIQGTWTNAFHTYGLYRGNGYADVYWDGNLVKSYSTYDNGAGESLVLTNGCSGSCTAGAQVKVDYVRAWNTNTSGWTGTKP